MTDQPTDKSRPSRDRSMFQPSERDDFSGRVIRANGIGNDFTKGHRGMARAVHGAKKFINSRRRFHERMALREIEQEDQP